MQPKVICECLYDSLLCECLVLSVKDKKVLKRRLQFVKTNTIKMHRRIPQLKAMGDYSEMKEINKVLNQEYKQKINGNFSGIRHKKKRKEICPMQQ